MDDDDLAHLPDVPDEHLAVAEGRHLGEHRVAFGGKSFHPLPDLEGTFSAA